MGTTLMIFLAIDAVVIAAIVVGARMLRARGAASALKTRPYECGEESEGPTWIQFHPRYYLIALVFLLFDVEAAFLFPYAIGSRVMGLGGVIAIGAFVGVLLLGWAYALRKGALEWR